MNYTDVAWKKTSSMPYAGIDAHRIRITAKDETNQKVFAFAVVSGELLLDAAAMEHAVKIALDSL